jgi:hypothetical protein
VKCDCSIERIGLFRRQRGMRQLPLWVGMVLFALLGLAQRARAADEPLLVVVEAKPGADVAPADIRAALREELKGPVLSPEDAKASEATRLLVVTLDGPTIRISLRDSPSELVTRTVAAPAGSSARLRTITWLAGNLARDQVTSIVDGPAPRSTSAVDAAPGASASDSASPVLQPAPVPQSVQPPAANPIATSSAPADSISGGPSSSTPNRPSNWDVTASGGPLLVSSPGSRSIAANGLAAIDLGSIYELRVQRRSEDNGLNVSLAAHFGHLAPGADLPILGVAGLVAKRWDERRWYVELAAGIGVEVAKLPTSTFTTTDSVTGFGTFVMGSKEQPGLLATGRVALGLPLSHSLEAVAELGFSAASLGLQAEYLSTTVGLRVRIP